MNNSSSNSAHSEWDIIPLFPEKINPNISRRVQSDASAHKSECFVNFPRSRLGQVTKTHRSHCLFSLSDQWSKNKEAFMPEIRIVWRSVTFVFSGLEKLGPLCAFVYTLVFMLCFAFFLLINPFFKTFLYANPELINQCSSKGDIEIFQIYTII